MVEFGKFSVRSCLEKNDPTMRYCATILITLLLAVPALSVELFRYRGAAKDGGTLEYVFEAGEQNSPNAVTKEKAAEIAADFMTTFITSRSAHLRLRNSRRSQYHSGLWACVLLGGGQGTTATNVFRDSPARWDGR